MSMPAIFLAHGSPENALADNAFTQSLTALGKNLPPPDLVVVLSAHWETEQPELGLPGSRPLLYDFYGFPDPLYHIDYPCPSPDPAHPLVRDLIRIAQMPAVSRGLDHGAWAVLRFLFPGGQFPICQMSLPRFWTPEAFVERGKALEPLRHQGVLFVGSGNLVHNLTRADFRAMERSPYPWALLADEALKEYIVRRDTETLAHYASLGTEIHLAIPTREHFLPALEVLGMAKTSDTLEFTHETIQNGSVSMRCFRCG